MPVRISAAVISVAAISAAVIVISRLRPAAVSVGNATPPAIGVSPPAAAAGDLDDIRRLLRVQARNRRSGVRRHCGDSQAERPQQPQSCYAHCEFLLRNACREHNDRCGATIPIFGGCLTQRTAIPSPVAHRGRVPPGDRMRPRNRQVDSPGVTRSVILVRTMGVEPIPPCGERILSPLRLPFRHVRLTGNSTI